MTITSAKIAGIATKLFESDGPAVTNEGARALEECGAILDGIVLASGKLGLSDTFGLLRANISGNEDRDSLKMLKALDALEAAGVDTQAPDLDTILTDVA